HEGIDHDPLLRAPLYLTQGLLEGAEGRRIGKMNPVALEVSGWLPIRYEDDLLGACLMLTQQTSRQDESVLHVRAVHVIAPGDLVKMFGTKLARVVREADDVQVVSRKLRPNEAVERQRNFLGGHEATTQRHRS